MWQTLVYDAGQLTLVAALGNGAVESLDRATCQTHGTQPAGSAECTAHDRQVPANRPEMSIAFPTIQTVDSLAMEDRDGSAKRKGRRSSRGGASSLATSGTAYTPGVSPRSLTRATDPGCRFPHLPTQLLTGGRCVYMSGEQIHVRFSDGVAFDERSVRPHFQRHSPLLLQRSVCRVPSLLSSRWANSR